MDTPITFTIPPINTTQGIIDTVATYYGWTAESGKTTNDFLVGYVVGTLFREKVQEAMMASVHAQTTAIELEAQKKIDAAFEQTVPTV